jgi:hypothetical protein
VACRPWGALWNSPPQKDPSWEVNSRVLHGEENTLRHHGPSRLWTYDTTKYLTGVDFSYYQFISVCREGFTHVMLEPMENRLNHK